jgi:hypothetical protein
LEKYSYGKSPLKNITKIEKKGKTQPPRQPKHAQERKI